jgi:hypothetical protein
MVEAKYGHCSQDEAHKEHTGDKCVCGADWEHSFISDMKRIEQVGKHLPVFHQARTSIKTVDRALVKCWSKYLMDSSKLTDLFGWHFITLRLEDHILCLSSVINLEGLLLHKLSDN